MIDPLSSIEDKIARTLRNAGVRVTSDLVDALAREVFVLAHVEAAKDSGRMIGRLGESPMAIAIERLLLPDTTPLREAARQAGVPRGTLRDAEARLEKWLGET